MEKKVASILLILSVAGGLLAAAEAAGSGDADTIIRLPSNSNGEDDDRPWECCDNARCTRSNPPRCQCLDRKCSDNCRECVLVEFGHEFCADWYRGTPPPKCHDKKDQPNNHRIVVRGDEEERPWECCDLARCTRKHPPSCQCLDRVDKCSDACKECVSVEFGSEVCADWYRGTPPPRCHDESQQINRIVHGVMKEARKKNGDDDERPPWKCCNRAVHGPSTTTPPVWYCMDKFDSCDCERCFEVKDDSNSKSYFCLDGYKGTDPGPSCTHDG